MSVKCYFIISHSGQTHMQQLSQTVFILWLGRNLDGNIKKNERLCQTKQHLSCVQHPPQSLETFSEVTGIQVCNNIGNIKAKLAALLK